MRLFFVCLFLTHLHAGPVLNNIPIVFEMTGSTTYTPDAGGISRVGYKLKVGYSNHQWLGVEIVTNTGKNDVLIVELNEFFTEGATILRTGHQVSVVDYYSNSGVLNIDQNNDYDISSYNYVSTKTYFIDLIRYVGSNSNQDWNAAANSYSLTQVCFYTSKTLFKTTSWKSGFKQCYFFEIDDYVSAFKGIKLKDFYLNGYQTGIYGWIDGPYVSDNVYLYHNTPLFSYTEEPAVAIEFGTTQNSKGQDFHVKSPISSETGDYYGKSVTNISKDTIMPGGFENGGLTLKHWNAVPATQIGSYPYTTLRIDFKRNITTFDPYDKVLKSTFIFCIYLFAEGTINSDLTDRSCEVVELGYHYPRMTMPKKADQFFTMPLLLFIVVIFLNL